MNIIYKDNIINDKSIFNSLSNDLSWISVTDTRHECFMSKNKISYTYGAGRGIRTYDSIVFNPIVESIMNKLNDEYNCKYDICFLNKYDNEKMHLGWHADDSPEIDLDHPIAVISLGAEREIWIKKFGFKGEIPKENKFLLKNGSLFIMPSGFQKYYLHKIPKWFKPCNTRISLTFRKYNTN